MNAMTMRLVRDAAGGVRHVPTPYIPPPPAARAKAKRHVPDPIKTNGESAAEQLRLLIERIERINEELAGLLADRADIFAEAKSVGFDVKGLRAILDLRRTEKHVRDEFEGIVETYRDALGLL